MGNLLLPAPACAEEPEVYTQFCAFQCPAGVVLREIRKNLSVDTPARAVLKRVIEQVGPPQVFQVPPAKYGAAQQSGAVGRID